MKVAVPRSFFSWLLALHYFLRSAYISVYVLQQHFCVHRTRKEIIMLLRCLTSQMKVKAIIFTPSPLGTHLSETNSFVFLLWPVIFSLSSNHQIILSFQKLLSSACGCVANEAYVTCYINDTVRHFCFKGHISSSNCKSAPFKYRSVVSYSVKKGQCSKYFILLGRCRGKFLDILGGAWRNSRILRRFSKKQLLLSNFRASIKNKALGKALTQFFGQA